MLKKKTARSIIASMPTWSPNFEQYNCRKLRVNKGWTLAEMAAATGIDKATLRTFEAGTRKPHEATVYRIAAGLGVSVEYLRSRPRGRPRYFWPSELTC